MFWGRFKHQTQPYMDFVTSTEVWIQVEKILKCSRCPAKNRSTTTNCLPHTLLSHNLASLGVGSCFIKTFLCLDIVCKNKKAQLSLTNPRDAKACQNCSNSTCLQRCRWQYRPIFMRLTAIASEIREIPINSLKIQTYGVQGHPRSSILVSIESPYVTCY